MATHSDNLQHLLTRDVPVAVQVVHGEGPLQLLLELAARSHAECAQELPEVYSAVAVRVERSEHVFCKLQSRMKIDF